MVGELLLFYEGRRYEISGGILSESKTAILDRLLSTGEVAQMLGVSRATIYSWIYYKTIPHLKLGRLVKFPESKILEWRDSMPSCEGMPLSASSGVRKDGIRIKKRNHCSDSRKHRRPRNSREDLVRGIYKVKNKSGVKYGIDYFDPIKNRRIKRIISSSKEEAEHAYRKIQVKIKEGKWSGINGKAPLFETFADSYLEMCKNQDSETHYKAKERCLRKKAADLFNGLRIDKISIIHIEKFKNQRIHEAGKATVNRDLAYLRHFFNKAIDWGYLKSTPLVKVKLFKEPPGRVRYLIREEIVLLLNNCTEEIRPIVILALNCGLRRGEIIGLMWQDIDLKNRRLIIQQSKSNTKRIVPINDAAYKVFESLSRTKDKVFQVPNFRRLFERAVNEAGIDDFTFHDLRHCFASFLAMAGANLVTIKELMGHKSIKMTLRYSHLCNGYLEDAVKKLQITP